MKKQFVNEKSSPQERVIKETLLLAIIRTLLNSLLSTLAWKTISAKHYKLLLITFRAHWRGIALILKKESERQAATRD